LAKYELVLNTFDDLAASKTLRIITQRGSGISHLNLEKSELTFKIQYFFEAYPLKSLWQGKTF
jgi:hypothetical protein